MFRDWTTSTMNSVSAVIGNCRLYRRNLEKSEPLTEGGGLHFATDQSRWLEGE